MGRKQAITAFLAALMLTVPAAFADPKPRSTGLMDLEDHRAFFQPGTYLTLNPETGEYARVTFTRMDFQTSGETIARRSTQSQVSTVPASRPGEEGQFLKLRMRGYSDEGLWDARNSTFIYNTTMEELYFDSEAWLSDDAELQVNPEDTLYGSADAYYDQAAEETGGDCCLDDEQYQSRFLGTSTARCAYLPMEHEWDVICHYRYVNSGERQREFFRREIDAIM